MKKVYQIKLYFFLFIFVLASQNIKAKDIEFISNNTIRASGLGGAISSVPVGIESLIYNPAGLKFGIPSYKKKWEILINADTYFEPKYLGPILEDIWETDNITSKVLINTKDLITASGTGASGSVAFGYTNNSFGIGLFSSTSLFVQGGPFPLGTEGFGQVHVSIPLAYSILLSDSSKYKFAIGLCIEPTVAIYKELDGKDIDAIEGGRETLHSIIFTAINHPYVSMPINIGCLFVIPNFIYSEGELRFSGVLDNLFSDFFAPGYNIKPLTSLVNFNTGLSFVLPFNLFEKKCFGILSAEIKSFNQVMAGNKSIWKAMRFGSEISFNDFLHVQLGLSSGYPCLAAEIELFGFALGCLWQTVESGKYVGDNPLSIFRLGISFGY